MTTKVHINLKRVIDDSYDIQISMPLDEAADDIIRMYPDSSKFVITDSNVGKYYGKKFVGALRQPDGHLLILPAGEKSKHRKSKERLEDKLIKLKASRDSVIIALGGGMVGDLAGFVASTLLRGISFVQIPTTLLAQVDSSVGGKVAVDHPLGKNLIGAFYQPKKVYIDPTTLETLSDTEFSNGMAEVIKYAAILDKQLFGYLEENSTKIRARNLDALHRIIKRCCELKKSVVQRDEKETGLRRILNFGHTIGHAVELLSHYRVSHGNAVAIGMIAEARISVNMGMLSTHAFERLERLITAYHLPTSLPKTLHVNNIIVATTRDKKAKGKEVHYTLLERIGKARVGVPISTPQVHKLLAE
jgi:3-dehydroquinate synthase